MKQIDTPASDSLAISTSGVSRRGFLGLVGGLAGAGLLVNATGCNKETDDNGIYLGIDDIAILNYAYALEQLEANFYIKVIQAPFSSIKARELFLLTNIRDHEIAHSEFFKNALGAQAIPLLTFNFDSVDFTDRSSVLNTAKAFEDLGVAAYNGAGKLIKDVKYLQTAGKIVSVEARHAAVIRDMIQPGSFAASDVIDMNGLDGQKSPEQVINIAKTFINETLNLSGIPKS